MAPDCKQKPFTRVADLDRHYQQVHKPSSEKEQHLCDYRNCPRREVPFHRKDHYRDHLREYHREDIFKRGSYKKKVSASASDKGGNRAAATAAANAAAAAAMSAEELLKEYNIQKSNWRCNKCLKRITVHGSGTMGWECPDCRISCDAERKRARLLMASRARRQFSS